MDDPYIESLVRNPLLRGPIERGWHRKLVRMAILWSVIAIIIALTYVIVVAMTGN